MPSPEEVHESDHHVAEAFKWLVKTYGLVLLIEICKSGLHTVGVDPPVECFNTPEYLLEAAGSIGFFVHIVLAVNHPKGGINWKID